MRAAPPSLPSLPPSSGDRDTQEDQGTGPQALSWEEPWGPGFQHQGSGPSSRASDLCSAQGPILRITLWCQT